MLTPTDFKSDRRTRTRRPNAPGIAIGGGSNRTTAEDGLVLHEVLLAAGENGAVIDQQFTSDIRIRDDDIELIAQEE